MQFTRRLHERIRSGEITCSVRIWKQPRVKVGGRYRLGEGVIEVDSIRQIDLRDITRSLARSSGFKGVADLLKTARHGRGEKVDLVQFRYLGESRGRRYSSTSRSPRT